MSNTNENDTGGNADESTNDDRTASGQGARTGTGAGFGANTRGTPSAATRQLLANYFADPTQYGGKRDLYDTLGYDNTIAFSDYLQRYLRQDVARRIVDAPADKTWQEWPDVSDDDDSQEETPFEAGIRELHDETGVLEALRNTDRYAGIGNVGALVIGFADGNPLSEPVDPASLPDAPGDAIAYLTPCHEGAIQKVTLNDDETSAEFGDPLNYRIDFAAMDTLSGTSIKIETDYRARDVHPDRVLLVEPDRPRLEAVYNRLMDLEKVTGASAELFWRGADYGLALNLDSDALGSMGTEQRRDLQDDIQEEAEAYYHGLQPFLKLAGVDVERLGGEDVNPSGIADLLLQLIAGTIKMPKRILTGSERGELASTQDRAAWLGHISERQQHFAEPHLLRPFLDRLIAFGILPPASSADRYEIDWPDLFELSELEEADVMSSKATAFNSAATGLMQAGLATVGEVRQEIFGWDPEVGAETGEAPPGADRVQDPTNIPGDTSGGPADSPPPGPEGDTPPTDGGTGAGNGVMPDDLEAGGDAAAVRDYFDELRGRAANATTDGGEDAAGDAVETENDGLGGERE